MPSPTRQVLVVAMSTLIMQPVSAQIRLGPESVPELSGVQTGSEFGSSVTALEDLDGDGVRDLAVGAPGDSEAWKDAGAVWILFMRADGSVKGTTKISALDGLETLPNERSFGERLSTLGDFRTPGVYEISAASAVGGRFLTLGSGGRIVSQRLFPVEDSPAASLILLGDIDGNGTADVAETRHNSAAGAIDIIPYSTRGDPILARAVRIGEGQGGWPDVLDPGDDFGASAANIGDLDGDGRNELVVGAPGDDDGFQESGALYVFFLQASGEVRSFQKISVKEGGFPGDLQAGDRFGTVVQNLGDLDGDGFDELAAGAPGDGAGTIWVLSLNANGTVRHGANLRLIDYGIPIEDRIRGNFENGLALVPDYGGDGIPDLAVGLPTEGNSGSVWLLPALADLASAVRFFEPDSSTSVVGSDIPIVVEASGIGGVSHVEISFRRGGDRSYFSAPMTSVGRSHRLEIPAFVSSSRGLEYYVTISNTGQKQTRQPPAGAYVSVPLTVPDGISVSVPFGEEATGYRIVSIPLEYPGLSLLDMLESNLETSDKSNWRAFTLTGGSVQELTNRATVLKPGMAFWLLSKEGGRILQPGTGRTVGTDAPVRLRMQREWNLIGNPFDFPVPVGSLSLKSGDEVDIRSYHADWETLTDAMQPREGYAVFSAQTDTLIIDPRPRDVVSKSHIGDSAADLAWSVTLDADAGRARDHGNIFGTSVEARTGWDRLDAAEPPRVGDFVSAYFINRDPSSPTTRLQIDVRAPIAPTATWHLEVVGARPRTVNLRFRGMELMPTELEAVLLDPVTGVEQNLRQRPAYSLVAGTFEKPRNVAIVVSRAAGTSDAKDDPGESPGLDAFPNPFTDAATILFTLAQPESPRVRVYDLTGRVVARLAVGEKYRAGRHSLVWDGVDGNGSRLPAGLYIVRLETEAGSASIALSLVR